MSEHTPIESAELPSLIAPTMDAFVAGSKPYLRKVTDEIYEQLLDGVQDYLKENAEWNLGQEIDRCRETEADNRNLRSLQDELLEALEALWMWTKNWDAPMMGDDEFPRPQIEAAIAKARGQS